MSDVRRALTIAGSDPSGGAGIQADLKTFAAFRVYGTSAVTAITVQNTAGVIETTGLSADLVTAQIEAIASDIRLHATKIGMLATSAIVESVAAAIDELELPNVVLDPVLVSSSGERLLDADGIQALTTALMPRVRVVTPNIPEAEVLSGCRITSPADRELAARRLHAMGAGVVVITGGHASDDQDEVVDLLFDGQAFLELRAPRVRADSPSGVHGTGCAFASALAARLAVGNTVTEAAALAQRYVAGAIAHAIEVGHGARVIDHFWRARHDTHARDL
jgi:hydroxymethylpyrimidine/phosphomethylpyrimidine kinase